MNFGQIFINSLYLLGTVFVCSLVYCIIVATLHNVRQQRTHKLLNDEMAREVNELLKKFKKDLEN